MEALTLIWLVPTGINIYRAQFFHIFYSNTYTLKTVAIQQL